jgi:uncharacterized protein (DUF1800 family)
MPATAAYATTPTAAPKGANDIFKDSFESAAPPAPAGPGAAVRVLNKLAYGPREGDIAAFNALGANDAARLETWVDQQLSPALDDSACTNRIAAAAYTTTAKSLAQLWSDHVRDRDDAGLADYPYRYYPAAETQCVRMLRAVYSKRQVYERMVEFWHDHFNVLGWEFNIAPVFVHYDRDVIRPRAFGNFRALLEEVAKSPAMLQFLDNKSSSVTGFNENFARELCELHTLGAAHYFPGNNPNNVPRDNNIPRGYCDNDVYEAARALTGWTMRDDHWQFPSTPEYDTGEFLYFDTWHDKASKYFLGEFIPAFNPGGALADGRAVMDVLCRHIGTARHICGKLIKRFIGDNAPPALLESAAMMWQAQWQASDQIAQVLRHILTAPEVLSVWGEKTKRPFEIFVQSMRATNAEFTPVPFAPWDPYGQMSTYLDQTGHGPFRWPTPDGYPDVGSKWQSVSSLAQTWRLMSRLPELRVPGTGDRAFVMRIEALTLAAFPSAAARTANAIVDFWIDRIIGFPIAAARRTQLVDFLRQNATADTALDLVADTLSQGVPQHYGVWNGGNLSRHCTIARLRATVSLIFALPEFYQR